MGSLRKLNYFEDGRYVKPVRHALFINTLWGLLLGLCISLMIAGFTPGLNTPGLEIIGIISFITGLAGGITLVVLRNNDNFPSINVANSGYYNFRKDIKLRAQHVLDVEAFDKLWYQRENISDYGLDREVKDEEKTDYTLTDQP